MSSIGFCSCGEDHVNELIEASKQKPNLMTYEEWQAKAIEDGWMKYTGTQEMQAAIANIMLGNKVMAGAEWYSKFMDELKPSSVLVDDTVHGCYEPKAVLEAAKKAAGIS